MKKVLASAWVEPAWVKPAAMDASRTSVGVAASRVRTSSRSARGRGVAGGGGGALVRGETRRPLSGDRELPGRIGMIV